MYIHLWEWDGYVVRPKLINNVSPDITFGLTNSENVFAEKENLEIQR